MSYDLRIVQLRYTKTQFEATNPTVSDGQLCVETDSGVYTVGAGAYMSIRGNATLSAQERVSADDVWNAMALADDRDSGGDPAPFIYVTAGDDATGIYRYQFMNEGKRCYVLLGATASAASLLNCVVWADGGGGAKWNVTDETGEVLYTSASDVATPDLATGWTLDQGTGPLPSIAGYPGPTVQDVLEQVAAKVGPQYRVWEGYVSQTDTDAPTVVELTNTLGAAPVLTYASNGEFRATLTGAFPTDKTSWWSGSAGGGPLNRLDIVPTTGNRVNFTSSVGGVPSDSLLVGAYFKVTVRVS